ncbi:MAG TPA: beta-propeller domain-containing protein [Nocardioidaceae bacterium]|nr:beta-propeller domain-containing protein [Nocardioidaceae bacterium]
MAGVSKRMWAVGAAALGLMAGAIVWIGGTGPGGSPAAAASGALDPFDDCDELRSWYVKTALPHVTAWGWDTDQPIPIMFEDVAVPMAARAAGPTPDTEAVGNGATGTNLQELDVDEPDLAKTNGEFVALIHDGDLVIVDASGAEPREIGRLDLAAEQHIKRLLLVGDRAVLLGATHSSVISIAPPVVLPRDRMVPGPYGMQTIRPLSTITTVDLSDSSEPTVTRTESIQGKFVSAREHNGIVRIVATSMPEFDFVQPTGKYSFREALAHNREVVRTAAPEDWLPTSRVDAGDAGPLMGCEDVRHPDEAAGLGTISVLTTDPDEPNEHSSTGVAADGDLTYASADRMYVATMDDGWSTFIAPASRPESATTEIHAFDVRGGTTSYVGSGEVRGRVPDRWAFSEDQGLLRVASTVGAFWQPKETRVTVLDERAGALRPIGLVGGLGPNEEIEAVRWFGPLAIVVTFRQTDPLYAVDLTDPAHPTVAGELEIPGFSAYLHPLGDDLILGVGQDGTRSGRLRGAQVSTFDLGDLTDPSRIDLLDFGGSRTSATETDARAFTYLPTQRMAFVPMRDWRGPDTVEVVRVATDGQVIPVTSIELSVTARGTRILPLDDGRAAIVAAGEVVRIAEPTAW